MSFLALERLEKRYPDGFHAVRGIDLAVERGEFIVLLGPSGCGKTTTLRMVAGLEEATAGTIRLDGGDVTRLRPSQRDVGMVFQFYALYPHLSVRANLLFPLENTGLAKMQREVRVDDIAAALGVTHLLERFPRQLPGGDQQRISLGRALVRQPRLWLMDEPLGTLDSDRREELREVIRAQQLQHGVTTLYVTHDQEEAMTLADRIVVMDQGVIRQAGTPSEVYESPADLFTAAFVGSPGMNRIDGLVTGGVCAPLGLPVALPDGPVVLGVRPEYLHPDDAGPLRGVVVMDEYLGAWRNLHLDCPCGRLVMRLPPGAAHRPGDAVGLRVDPAHVLCFAPGDGRRLA
ncbi:MAG: ABC transporter ATP-binding protein [Planctomycetes bacterium]|nr:ABC transporter ATP-binding protein [Planctomycetota bacterium]